MSDLQHIDLQAALNELSSVVSNRPTARLSDQQQQAVRAALKNKVTVLTGGPGTGKTTTMRAVIDLLEKYQQRYALASPTGRAAKRLSQATDRPAKTIHRLLEYRAAAKASSATRRIRWKSICSSSTKPA